LLRQAATAEGDEHRDRLPGRPTNAVPRTPIGPPSRLIATRQNTSLPAA
jgi:hypothetical protein